MKAVVIGAGFAGLGAALRLAKLGYQVTVLEQQSGPGGKAIGFQGLPSGPTVLTMPHVVQRIFAETGGQAPALQEVSPLTQYTWPDGRRFAPERNLDATLAQLSVSEARDYRRLLQKAEQLYRAAAPTFIEGPPPGFSQLAQYGLRHGWAAQPLQGLEALVRSGPYLSPFFLRFATYMGANPYQAPAVLHNIAWVELGMGVYHAVGGMQGLALALAQLAERLGVQMAYEQRVVALQTQQHRVYQVHTAQGSLDADLVVSAADRHFTLGWLGWPPPKYPLGVSGLALLFHLDQELPLSHQVFFSSNYAAEWQQLSRGQLAAEPTLYWHTDGPKGFLLVNMPNLGLRPASDLSDYAQHLEALLRQKVLMPKAQRIVLTPQHYSHTARLGALYGKAPHGLLGTLRHGWRVGGLQNLVQVGGTVHPGGGVPLSLLSGWNGAAYLQHMIKSSRS